MSFAGAELGPDTANSATAPSAAAAAVIAIFMRFLSLAEEPARGSIELGSFGMTGDGNQPGFMTRLAGTLSKLPVFDDPRHRPRVPRAVPLETRRAPTGSERKM